MELPLFPLHTVLFPGRPLPLHLFEPRYRQMLADCLAGDEQFGVVAIRSGHEVGAEPRIFEVGTVARICNVEELPDGRYDILTRGLQRFRVTRRLPGTPYLRAEVELLPDRPTTDEDCRLALALRQLLIPYLARLGAPPALLARVPRTPCELSYLTAATLQIELPELQQILEAETTAARLSSLVQLLRRESGFRRHLGVVGSLRPASPGGADLN